MILGRISRVLIGGALASTSACDTSAPSALIGDVCAKPYVTRLADVVIPLTKDPGVDWSWDFDRMRSGDIAMAIRNKGSGTRRYLPVFSRDAAVSGRSMLKSIERGEGARPCG